MGQQCADVEAHVKSLFSLNEMLVSEVHIDGSDTKLCKCLNPLQKSEGW